MKTLLLPLSFLLFPLFAAAQNPCAHPDIIVQLTPGVQPEIVVRSFNSKWPSAHFSLKETLSKRLRAYLLEVNCDAFSDLGLLRKEATIRSASWNEPIELRRDSIPNDTLFPSQWNLDKIRLPEVWSLAQGGQTPNGKEIVVAVIDNGFDFQHPDLQANFWRNTHEILNGQDDDGNEYPDDIFGWNFHDNNPLFPINSTHGTNVMGIIAAQGNNVTGLVGVNWRVKILPLQFDRNSSEVLKAMDYVLDMREKYNQSNGEKGAFVVAVNGSFGLVDLFDCSDIPIWDEMYDSLGAVGVLSVAATRNDNYNIDEVGDIPTTCGSEYLITVTATNPDDLKLDSVAYGKTTVDLGAPGFPIPTTDVGGGYRFKFEGTSAACPHVTGTIALLYSLPCSDLDQLVDTDPAGAALLFRDAILKGVDKLPNLKNKTVTGGRLDAYNAMKYLHSYCIAKPDEREAGDFDETYIGGRGFVEVHPNPVTDKLTIAFSISDFQVLRFRIYNILGQEMQFEIKQQAEPFEPQSFEIDVSEWAAGTYFINIFDLGKKISTKFVKL